MKRINENLRVLGSNEVMGKRILSMKNAAV